MMSPADILDHPVLYRLWQAPFATQKLAPVQATWGNSPPTSVLDVGCGPGTNTGMFAESPVYVGVDLNERYIEYARRRYSRDFRVTDVTLGLESPERFDLILLNSLMHHLDDEGASTLLRLLPGLLTPSGKIHIIDLVLPNRGLPRRLALADRGNFPRPVDEWSDLVGGILSVESVREFGVGLAGLTMWKLVHIVGGRPEGSRR